MQGKLILWSTDIFDKKAKIIVPPGLSVIVLTYYRLIYPKIISDCDYDEIKVIKKGKMPT